MLYEIKRWCPIIFEATPSRKRLKERDKGLLPKCFIAHLRNREQNIFLSWQKNSSHALDYDEISVAREWLSHPLHEVVIKKI